MEKKTDSSLLENNIWNMSYLIWEVKLHRFFLSSIITFSKQQERLVIYVGYEDYLSQCYPRITMETKNNCSTQTRTKSIIKIPIFEQEISSTNEITHRLINFRLEYSIKSFS